MKMIATEQFSNYLLWLKAKMAPNTKVGYDPILFPASICLPLIIS